MNERLRVAVVGTGEWWGASTPASSPSAPTSSCVRSSDGRATRRSSEPPSSRRRHTSTWTRCSKRNVPISCRCACPTRATSTRRCASSRRASRCSSRSRSCSICRRPTGCCRKPRIVICSSRSTSTIDTPARCSSLTRRSRQARSARSRSRRGDSAARSGPAHTRTPTSSRRSAMASTCSSTCAARSQPSAPTCTDPAGNGFTTVAVALTFASGAVGSLVGSVRLVVRLSGDALRRGQRLGRAGADRRHGQAVHAFDAGQRSARGVGGRLLQRS